MSPLGEQYVYSGHLRAIDACRPEIGGQLPAGLRSISTPLSWSVWAEALSAHPD